MSDDTHMKVGKAKMRCYGMQRAGWGRVCVGVASVLEVQLFFIKENWICTMPKHHC